LKDPFNTPKALANFSPWLFQPWVKNKRRSINAESVGEPSGLSPTLSALILLGIFDPRVGTTMG
jgi:hypothetical protein